MPKSREQKKEILENLKDKIGKSKSIVFASFDKLEVKESEELRTKLKAENSEYYVAKKTLLEKAFKDENIENLDPRKFEGRIAAVFGYEDEVAPAKLIAEFQKDHEDKVGFVAGILENKLLSSEEVIALSKLLSKQELYAKIVGSINAPVSGFVNVLAGNIRCFVNVLKAVEEKKGL
jgi:large subunit ribosomal protein L10